VVLDCLWPIATAPAVSSILLGWDLLPFDDIEEQWGVGHVFGTLKHWMGSTHFLTRGLANVGTEMSLHVLAYNLKRVISVLGIAKTLKAVQMAGA